MKKIPFRLICKQDGNLYFFDYLDQRVNLNVEAGRKKGDLGEFEIRTETLLDVPTLERLVAKRITAMEIFSKAYGYEIKTAKLKHPDKSEIEKGKSFFCNLHLYAIIPPKEYVSKEIN